MSVMDPAKKAMSTVKNNAVGAIVGGVAGFYAHKKFSSNNKWWVKALFVVGGVVVGATAQSMIVAKSGAKKSQSTLKK